MYLHDVDFIHGDSLTYSATLADGSPLPAWLTFDAATQPSAARRPMAMQACSMWR